jgi:TM2 domain-containing membrane protein YozV
MINFILQTIKTDSLMKKISLLVVFILSAALTFAGSNYKLNDEKIDQLFSSATEISVAGLAPMSATAMNIEGITSVTEVNNKILIAWIVDWIGLGFFGIHRYVLGTKASMWAIYTFTCGGIFYIVPFIDWVVLLINGLVMGQGDKYLNNNKFFMWAN